MAYIDSSLSNGDKIKRLIQRRGLTQAEFAEDMDCEERTVRKWIHNGVYDIRLVQQIARTLDCDVLDLIPE
jgi:transcriptional regulator with XRE-family HTH domain